MRKVPFLSILLCAILLTACGAPAAAPEIGGAGAQEAATPTPAVGLGGPGEMLGFIVEDDGQIPGYMMMHGFLRTAENLGYPAKLYRGQAGPGGPGGGRNGHSGWLRRAADPKY